MNTITENTIINGRPVADYALSCGSVEVDGKKYVLLNQASYENNARFDPPDEYYVARAVRIGDKIRKTRTPYCKFPYAPLYTLEWDLSPDYNPDDADESNACEWDKPRDVCRFGFVDLTDGREF